MLAVEYGWTTEYFLTRTLKEIDWRVRTIQERRESEWKMQAALHNKEIKVQNEGKQKKVKLSPEEEKRVDAALEAAKKRVKKRHGR